MSINAVGGAECDCQMFGSHKLQDGMNLPVFSSLEELTYLPCSRSLWLVCILVRVRNATLSPRTIMAVEKYDMHSNHRNNQY